MKSIISFLLILTICTPLIAQDDPYIWLEEVESDKSMDWVKTQNKLTTARISEEDGFITLQEQFQTAYNDKDKIAYPSTRGEYVYNFWKDAEHVRGIWRRTKQEDYLNNADKWEIILDLDALSKEEDKNWVFHGAEFLKPENRFCLLALSDGGTDEDVVREFDVEKKTFVKGGFNLPSSKGGSCWVSKDEILIARNFGEGSLTTSGYPRIIKRLKRGESIDKAATISTIPDTLMGCWPYSEYVEGVYHAFITNYETIFTHKKEYLSDGELITLNIPKDAENGGIYKGKLILQLNSDWKIQEQEFKTGSLISVDFEALTNNEIKAKLVYQPDELSSVSGYTYAEDFVLVNTIRDVQSVLLKCSVVDSEWKQEIIKTPEFGSISIIDVEPKSNNFFYIFSNFITPTTLYRSVANETSNIKQLKPMFNAEGLVVKQYKIASKDGTMIPYFIVHKKDIVLDGSNPTLVYAYGGFNISQRPNYKPDPGIGWIQDGGVYVVASIRGGGEYGPEWHKGAMKEKRQNAYDDFYAVSEDLIEKKITSPDHLGAFGWSNGGLMAGVVATQRPDLFNAVIIGAPLLDMKRFSHMLAGASWMGEYGNPDTDDWEFIKKYSPYHNVHEGEEYPEVLFMTSTKDDRVHPAHARKMAARMIEQGHPILYYETIEGGHGASSTNEQAAFNSALMFTYLKMKLK